MRRLFAIGAGVAMVVGAVLAGTPEPSTGQAVTIEHAYSWGPGLYYTTGGYTSPNELPGSAPGITVSWADDQDANNTGSVGDGESPALNFAGRWRHMGVGQWSTTAQGNSREKFYVDANWRDTYAASQHVPVSGVTANIWTFTTSKFYSGSNDAYCGLFGQAASKTTGNYTTDVASAFMDASVKFSSARTFVVSGYCPTTTNQNYVRVRIYYDDGATTPNWFDTITTPNPAGPKFTLGKDYAYNVLNWPSYARFRVAYGDGSANWTESLSWYYIRDGAHARSSSYIETCGPNDEPTGQPDPTGKPPEGKQIQFGKEFLKKMGSR